MNFPAGLFGDAWAYGAFVPLALVWLWCLRTAPWRRLAGEGQFNVWLGAIVVLMLLWSMKAGVRPGLNLHLLGVTAMTLMFGRQLAIAGLSLVLVAVTFNGGAGWQAYALNALVMAVLPVFVAFAVLRFVERWLPANFFIYVFVAAFFGAAVVAGVTGVAGTALLAVAGVYPAELLLADYFPYFLLLGFSEAWLNGAAVTLMVVYFPHWVGTFDDRRYLLNK
ncbi:MAG: energy-coupling factor ABC transporter permease [Gammaproteobacteria bacterium]|nr:energy-coupling factor ABC transporter permease [Gammaproteobacteria bacterium]MBU1646507.1 energy-coupling factor ABC transporter permease [Gammaproteobacteria bacterium]MBU1971869.1 energy-coupling factor ABC transporter permease [Gammaproteobacteria bacterium]